MLASCRTDKAPDRDVWLHQICFGSAVALQGPRLRSKSPALQARLAELQKKLEQHQYDVMLQGIADKARNHLLSQSNVAQGFAEWPGGCGCQNDKGRGGFISKTASVGFTGESCSEIGIRCLLTA